MSDLIDRQAVIDALDNIKIPRNASWYPYYQQALTVMSRLPSVQPEPDCISRQAAIDALARMMPRSYTPDGSHPADEEIFRAQEVFVDCIEALEILPSVQPEIIRCKDCDWWTKQEDGVQGRCELLRMYPARGWYCGSARRRGGDST